MPLEGLLNVDGYLPLMTEGLVGLSQLEFYLLDVYVKLLDLLFIVKGNGFDLIRFTGTFLRWSLRRNMYSSSSSSSPLNYSCREGSIVTEDCRSSSCASLGSYYYAMCE